MTQEELNEILKQHQLWFDTKGEEGKRANLKNANLKGANLEYVNLTGVDLRYAYLKGVDLRDVNLRFADLSGVNLRFADLRGADLRGADLRYADLVGVNLIAADLTSADLSGANLTDTGIYIFEGPTHQCTYNSKDDKLYIGCQVHNLEHWLNNYIDIGKEHEYTDKDIEAYGNWIKSLKELPK